MLIKSGDRDETMPFNWLSKMPLMGSKSVFFALPDTYHKGGIESELLVDEEISGFIYEYKESYLKTEIWKFNQYI